MALTNKRDRGAASTNRKGTSRSLAPSAPGLIHRHELQDRSL